MKRKWLFRILRYGLGLLIALLIFWGFYGFVKNDNWLAVSALATLVLALGAFLAIWQNHLLQKRERRERLLNEIIEWAKDVAKCGIEADTPELSEDKNAEKAWPFLDAQERKIDILQLLRAMSVYIGGIAQGLDPSQEKAVSDAIESLRTQLKCLYEYKDFVTQYKDKKISMDIKFLENKAREVDKENRLLYNSAVKVLEQAAKIKTKDIG